MAGMKLYIANTTKQYADFVYRLPESNKLYKELIRPGAQIVLPVRDMTSDMVDYVVDQHRIYGLINVKDIARDKAYHGLCFSVDRPINLEALYRAIEANDIALADTGRRIRMESAIALDAAVRAEDSEVRVKPGSEITMEFREINEKTGEDAGTIAEGVRVTHEGPTAPAPRKRGRSAL